MFSVNVADAPVRPVVLQVIVMPGVPIHFASVWSTPPMEYPRTFQSVHALLSDSRIECLAR